jgi:adenylosuccinate lyase
MSVLGERYASPEIKNIWSREAKTKFERLLWISVMKSQAKAGMSIPPEVISDYVKVVEKINLASIDDRERLLHHDVKARIEEFNNLAGHEFIHLGMTSRDLTENIELYQSQQSLRITAKKSAALLYVLSSFVTRYSELPIVARTHNVPAQVTTLGRKFATWGEELLFALEHLEEFLKRLPIRGIKGAVGTASDLEQLLPGKSAIIESELASLLGFDQLLSVPSQIYPRSIDLEMVAVLNQLAAAPANVAINIRLMAGNGLVSEGFEKDQTGSSAMPHKINPRLSERINSLSALLKGYLTMVSEISGGQWNEGDVSCSAVRRIALPEAFFAIDAILETTIHVLTSLHIYEDKFKDELKECLPSLLSSTLLMHAVNAGVGREFAHQRIKHHFLGREGHLNGDPSSIFLKRVLNDKELKIEASAIQSLIDSPIQLAGLASQQVKELAEKIREKIRNYPDAMSFGASGIL